MKESELFEKIESYIKHQMSEKDRILFEREISQDALLEKKVKQQQQEQKILELLVEKDLKAKLVEWDKSEIITDKNVNKFNQTLLLVLVGLVIIGGIFWFYSNQKQEHIDTFPINQSKSKKENTKEEIESPKIEESIHVSPPKKIPSKQENQPVASQSQKINSSKEKGAKNDKKTLTQNSKLLALAEKHFIPFSPTTIESRSIQATNRDSIRQILSLFEAGNYQVGNQLLKALILNTPENTEFQYYLGVGLYSDRQFNQAIQYLKPILKDPNFLYFEEVEWTLALSYIFQTEYLKGKEILQEIAKDSEHTYFQQSTRILSSF